MSNPNRLRSRDALRSTRFSSALALGLSGALFIAACGETEKGPPDPGTPPGNDPGQTEAGLAAPPEAEGVQLRMQLKLTPGQESTYCRHFVLPKKTQLDIGRFQ